MRFVHVSAAALFAALAGMAPAMAGEGTCNAVICNIPDVHIHANGVMSQADVAKQLKQMGYTNIRLSPYSPTTVVPCPQLSHPTPTSDLAKTPAHRGWNGTAEKNGDTANVYVDF
ncbi:hypothetical protein [Acidocella sp.]|jgi:hypothetical protein|uniref:hypothetical protein n=1 Tax=Acidocella sp. TaxID=50710 RepID=UPI00261456EB|nr:hypothetical protein [Acidocella sp.]